MFNVLFLLSSVALAQPLNIPRAPAPPQAPPFPEARPSRYEGGNFDAYLAEIGAKLAMKSRPVDPFGAIQDPEAKAALEAASPIASKAAAPALTLSQIIERLEINTIMPRERRFLIGSRTIKQGDRLPLSIHGKILNVTVTEVTSGGITFQNPATGETARKNLSTLPAGMTPGSASSGVPGMQRAAEPPPIDLDVVPER
ncbi:MAG: hypothetical protein QM627_07265 [Luteolibacter sp.]